MQDFLVIDNVTKSFGPLRAVDGVSLKIAEGEVFSLLGPSGCGKTTLLRMLAGFEQPDNGCIFLNGRDITALPPERRPVNTVFQNYALFPHLSVSDNIAFGLRMAKKPKAVIHDAVARMIDLVRLKEHARKRPAQLSGGQRQRVAIARALINEPQVLLLDEPLAALDLKLRQHMLSELTALHQEVGTTFIYVTHDQGEAMSLSDRIAVLHEGRVEQVANPVTLYEAPATPFVASFIGDANFFQGVVREGETSRELIVDVPGFGSFMVLDSTPHRNGEKVRVMVRPEKLMISREAPVSPINLFRGRVDEVHYFGAHTRIRLGCGGQAVHVQCQSGPEWPIGSEAWVSFAPQEAHLLDE